MGGFQSHVDIFSNNEELHHMISQHLLVIYTGYESAEKHLEEGKYECEGSILIGMLD
jgi:hypothetical protein